MKYTIDSVDVYKKMRELGFKKSDFEENGPLPAGWSNALLDSIAEVCDLEKQVFRLFRGLK